MDINIIDFQVEVKKLLKEIVEDNYEVFFEDVDEDYNVYPYICFKVPNLSGDEQYIGNIEVDIWDNQGEDILRLETITQTLYNKLKTYRKIRNHMFIRTSYIKKVNANTGDKSLKRRILDITFKIN